MFPFNILDHFSFGKKRIQREREKLIAELNPFRNNLVPIEPKDLDLLSFTISDKKGANSKSGKGLFISIYDEPMVAFSYSVFNHTKLKKLIMAETANHHILYMDRNSHTDCYFNNQLIGKIAGKDLLYSPRKRLLGRINQSEDKDYSNIIYKDQELAVFNALEEESKFNKRVFDIVKNNISREEQVILMTLSFQFLIKELMNVPN